MYQASAAGVFSQRAGVATESNELSQFVKKSSDRVRRVTRSVSQETFVMSHEHERFYLLHRLDDDTDHDDK